MSSLAILSSCSETAVFEQFSGDDITQEAENFSNIPPHLQVQILREFLAVFSPEIANLRLCSLEKVVSELHAQITIPGHGIAWGDEVFTLIPLALSNGLETPSKYRWVDRAIFLRADGQVLILERDSVVDGNLIKDENPSRVEVRVATDDELLELVAEREMVVTVLRSILRCYWAYLLHEKSRVDREGVFSRLRRQYHLIVKRVLSQV